MVNSTYNLFNYISILGGIFINTIQKNRIRKRSKAVIPYHTKNYYIYDSNNYKLGYNAKVSIDTIQVLLKLTNEQIQIILNNFQHQYLHNRTKNHYDYLIQNELEGISMRLVPRFPTTTHNVSLLLQRPFTVDCMYDDSVNTMRKFVLELLNHEQDYYIRRLDVATDFYTDFSKSFSFKRNGNQRKKNYDDYLYVGSGGNPHKSCLVAHYDRTSKGITDTDYLNRFECKMYFNQSDQFRFDNIRDNLIMAKLQRELFFPYINDVKGITPEEKRLLLQSKDIENEGILRERLDSKEYTKLRNKLKQQRVRLEQLYIEQAYFSLFDFLIK